MKILMNLKTRIGQKWKLFDHSNSITIWLFDSSLNNLNEVKKLLHAFLMYIAVKMYPIMYIFLSKAIFFPVSESKKTSFNNLSEFLRYRLQLGWYNHSRSLICQLSYFVTFILTKIPVNEKFGKSKIFPHPLKFTMQGVGWFPLVENPWPNIFHRGNRYWWNKFKFHPSVLHSISHKYC